MADLVEYQVDNSVATISLNSPSHRNALSRALLSELHTHISKADQDPAVRVIVLTTTSDVFCSGMDLVDILDPDIRADSIALLSAVLQDLWELPKPTIARVLGPARAGGIGLIAACDIAVADSAATFSFSEVRIGVVPALISALLHNWTSPRMTHELFLTGETFDAHRAQDLGLINSVARPGELEDQIEHYVDLLLLGAQEALAGAKQLLRRRSAASLSAEFDALAALSEHYFSSEEGREGIAAFRAKRPPNWAVSN